MHIETYEEPEYWIRMISPYPNHDTRNFMISSHGRIYNIRLKRLAKFIITPFGYEKVSIDNKTCVVHRLVMMSFHPIPDPDKYQVNHIDCNKRNNKIYNLEWCTPSQNINHAYENNLIPRGENHPKSVLTNEQVHSICQCISISMTYSEIYDYLNIDYDFEKFCSIINSMRRRKSYMHISEGYIFPELNDVSRKFTDEQVHYICRCLELGKSYGDILLELGLENVKLSRKILGKIRSRYRYADISSQYNFLGDE